MQRIKASVQFFKSAVDSQRKIEVFEAQVYEKLCVDSGRLICKNSLMEVSKTHCPDHFAGEVIRYEAQILVLKQSELTELTELLSALEEMAKDYYSAKSVLLRIKKILE